MKETIKELTLMLMYLTAWEEDVSGDVINRSWKGYNFNAINELIEEGYINSNRKSKSVYLLDEGMDYAQKLVEKYGLNDK